MGGGLEPGLVDTGTRRTVVVVLFGIKMSEERFFSFSDNVKLRRSWILCALGRRAKRGMGGRAS